MWSVGSLYSTATICCSMLVLVNQSLAVETQSWAGNDYKTQLRVDQHNDDGTFKAEVILAGVRFPMPKMPAQLLERLEKLFVKIGSDQKFTFMVIRHGRKLVVYQRRSAEDDFPLQIDDSLMFEYNHTEPLFMGTGYKKNDDGTYSGACNLPVLNLRTDHVRIKNIRNPDATSELQKYDLDNLDAPYYLLVAKHKGVTLFRSRHFDDEPKHAKLRSGAAALFHHL
eukprot:Lankesteria_metandrocarpae@DN5267_c0_g1_i4.p1